MQLNLSAEMIHALYCAAKGKKPDAEQKEKLNEFTELIEFMTDEGIEIIMEERRNNSEPL